MGELGKDEVEMRWVGEKMGKKGREKIPIIWKVLIKMATRANLRRGPWVEERRRSAEVAGRRPRILILSSAQ